MGIKKKKKSLGGMRVMRNPDEEIVLTPPWIPKLKEQFAFSNNPGRWKDRQTVDAVIEFIKIELNEPIKQYEHQLALMWRNKLAFVISQGHGGGNYRRLILQLLAEVDKELQK